MHCAFNANLIYSWSEFEMLIKFDNDYPKCAPSVKFITSYSSVNLAFNFITFFLIFVS